jgi:protein-S-isoprenylcysteine O-methyltransferase Ste14
MRELSLRAAMVGLVVAALNAPSMGQSATRTGAGLATFGAGTALAMFARHALGASWGIGVRPHGAERGSRPTDSLYRLLRHPIYVGTTMAIAGQSMVLGDRWSFAMLAAALVVTPLKAARERVWLRRAGVSPGQGRHAPGDTAGHGTQLGPRP